MIFETRGNVMPVLCIISILSIGISHSLPNPSQYKKENEQQLTSPARNFSKNVRKLEENEQNLDQDENHEDLLTNITTEVGESSTNVSQPVNNQNRRFDFFERNNQQINVFSNNISVLVNAVNGPSGLIPQLANSLVEIPNNNRVEEYLKNFTESTNRLSQRFDVLETKITRFVEEHSQNITQSTDSLDRKFENLTANTMHRSDQYLYNISQLANTLNREYDAMVTKTIRRLDGYSNKLTQLVQNLNSRLDIELGQNISKNVAEDKLLDLKFQILQTEKPQSNVSLNTNETIILPQHMKQVMDDPDDYQNLDSEYS